MKTKQILRKKSSEKLAEFLKDNALHKRDFAEMIGVTLSYVYNLTDETVPFSTRGTTIERIATVMEVNPEEFEEYKIPQEPVLIDETIETFKKYMKQNKLTVVTFLKSFPRRKRLEIVDMLRGAMPVPIDYKEIQLIGKTLSIPTEEVYAIWEKHTRQALINAGINQDNNHELIDTMFECAHKFLRKMSE